MFVRALGSRIYPLFPYRYITLAEQRTVEYQWTTKDPYRPLHPLTYDSNGKYLVFDQPSKGIRQLPYEIKETSVRNTIGVIVSEITTILLPSFIHMSTFFVANFAFQVLRRMTRAISKIELLEGGKKVRMTRKMGGSFEVDICKIQKQEDEAKLLSTYAEPYLYPIEVTNNKGRTKKYYIYGQGFLPIKNGEVFRAIINGKELIDGKEAKSK